MPRFGSAIRLLVAIFAFSWHTAAFCDELPTADEVLRIHRENKARLSRLHLRLVLRYESTAAAGRAAAKQAEATEALFKSIDPNNPDQVVITGPDGKQLDQETVRQYLQYLKRDASLQRKQTKAFQTVTPIEIFQNGDEYQVRQPSTSIRKPEQLAKWEFPEAPLTAETLLSDYQNVTIFSRTTKSTPPARWWVSKDHDYGYVMTKNLTDVNHVNLPPLTDVMKPGWDVRHHYDAFFSKSAEEYRVIGEEEIDGRRLTVVDVSVPIVEHSENQLAYRAWLDLKRGALPIRLYHRQSVGETPKDQFDRWQPTETVRTLEIRELPGGAFYPVKTVREMWAVDSDAPMPTEAELEEIRAGTRKQALVVHRRYTWDCSIVEIKQDYPDGFFVIPFPDDQPLHDHDTGKLVGAPERKPLVEVGQEAPPLSVALWLDGKERTLADLKGQVVVLDFWGLWCSACRSGVPGLKTLQEGFRDKPVTFISIHTGEKKPLEAMGRIREFKTKNDWSFLGAIDKGRISEDSVTSNAYGIRSFPTLVIIGKDGRIAYVDPDLDGPACDEENPALIAEYEQRVSEVMKPRYAAVGETWPISSELPEEEQRAIFARAEAAYIKLQIEMALGK